MELAQWQQVVVVAAAVAAVGFMAVQIARLQLRSAGGDAAVSRGGDAVESGLYGARAADGAQVFDGFSYRDVRFAIHCYDQAQANLLNETMKASAR